jgi:putative peptidoglycan lipid II flippase
MSQYIRGTTGQMRVILTSANTKIFRALLSIASAALLIRMMGMFSQVVITSRFGEGAAMDAYFVASALPIMIAQLLSSAIEASVIPVFTRVRARGKAEQASILFSTTLNLLLIGAALLTVMLFLFRDQVIHISAPAIDPLRMGIANSLAPIIYPVLFLMMVIGFLECILNAEGQFGWPSYAGLLVPATTAVCVILLGRSQGVVMLCVGMVVGLCLQLGAFIVRTRRANIVYRPIIDLRNPAIGSILITAWPALLGGLISQTSPFVDQVFASFLSTGSISTLNYALKLISVPTGVIFVSVGRAALPYLSQQAAISDMKAFRGTLHFYLWIVGIGTMVMSLLMLLLAHPLVQLLFQHGAFTPEDTSRTAATFMGFVPGLVPMSFAFIATRAFSALGKTRFLLLMSIYNVIANILFDALFARLWQSEGIAIATSAVYFGAMVLLFFLLKRTVGSIDFFSVPPEILAFFKKLPIFPSVGKLMLRIGIVMVVFSAGIIGIFLNGLYTLRISLGSVAILAFLRYRYALLITWILLDVFISSTLTIFTGNNFDTALTVPTLLLMTRVPISLAFKRLPALAVLLLYLSWVFAGIGISQIGVGAFLTNWILLVDYVAVCVLLIHVITTRRRMMGLIDTILLVSLFVALYGIYGFFTHQNGVFDPFTLVFRIFSLFNASPPLALFLSLFIPLMIYRTFTLRGFLRIGGLVGVLILLVGVVLTFTRTAYISVPLSILMMMCFLPSRKMKMRLFGGIFVLTVLAVLLATVGHLPIFDRFVTQDISTLNGRTYLWQALLDHFDATQLLGNGLEASNILLTNLQVGYRGVVGTAPHSLILGTLYDHGIIGVLLLLAVFFTLFVNLLRGILRATGEHRVLFAAAMAVFVSVAVQSLDSNDFWDQSICLYFWMIMALPFAAYWSMQQAAEIEEDIADRPTLPGVIITTNTQERSGLSDHEGSRMQKHEPERPEKGYMV